MEHSARRRGPLVAGTGARNEATRQHNLSTVLTLVHHTARVSRAALTEQTGLNRSTIGGLVASLVQAGLVWEDTPLVSGAGRPSPLVRPSADVHVAVVHPDVDSVRVAVVALGASIVARATISCDEIPSPSDVLDLGVEALRGLGFEPEQMIGIAIAVPGLVEVGTGTVVAAPHLGWRQVALDQVFASIGVPVHVRNDARVGLIAESVFGAARGKADVLYLNGSASGIGGGTIADSVVIVGARGFAGEFGHTSVVSNGTKCHCGRLGCLETEVNIRALTGHASGHLADTSVEGLGRAIRAANDKNLMAEVARQAEVLGRGLGNVVTALNPSTVVLAGFLADIHDATGSTVVEAMRRHSFVPMAEDVEVVNAELGDDRVIIGAAEAAFRPMLANPLAVSR